MTPSLNLNTDVVEIGRPEEISPNELPQLENRIRELMPWRKGPFKLFGTLIDSEWKSDMKWNRIAPHLGDLKGKRVLDVGCNNGYFMFRLMGAGAKEVLGIDPIECFHRQFQFLQDYANVPDMEMKSLGIEDLNRFENAFDLVLPLGNHLPPPPHPLGQLQSLRKVLKPGGRLISESIGIPGDTPVALTPRQRYANMRNVHFVPTLSALISWMERAKLRNVTPLFSTAASSREQRATDRCLPGYKSFAGTLDPLNPSLTREGYPAPLRLAVSAEK